MKLIFVPNYGFQKHGDVRLLTPEDPALSCQRVLVELLPDFNEEGDLFTYVGFEDRAVSMDDFDPVLNGQVFLCVACGDLELVKQQLIMGLVKFQPTLPEIYSWMYDLYCTMLEAEKDPEYDDQGGTGHVLTSNDNPACPDCLHGAGYGCLSCERIASLP
jgi:hypothetical protein